MYEDSACPYLYNIHATLYYQSTDGEDDVSVSYLNISDIPSRSLL